MFRVFLIAAFLLFALLRGTAVACADGFDALINLELAFRDTILDKPAPHQYESLIREGETTITFVRELPDAVGKTDFFLNLDWTYDYRYTTRTTGGTTEVEATAVKVQPQPRLRHLIRMPVSRYRADVWESRLLGHEFDHVSVSLDPRPRAMLVHLCKALPSYRFSLAGESRKPSDQEIRDGINREIQRRHSAIVDLVRANYAALDKVSQNGRLAMQDRSNFFDTLYTRANIETTRFPYQQEVSSLLESDAYRQLRRWHVPADPTTLPRR